MITHNFQNFWCLCMLSNMIRNVCVLTVHLINSKVKRWPEPFINGVYLVSFAEIWSNIPSYTAYVYGSGQPCISAYSLHHYTAVPPAWGCKWHASRGIKEPFFTSHKLTISLLLHRYTAVPPAWSCKWHASCGIQGPSAPWAHASLPANVEAGTIKTILP